MPETKSSPPGRLVGFGDIKRPPIGGWQEYLRQGKQFLAAAVNGFARRRQVFTAEILYNLVAMAIEKLIMALLMESGNLPYNHTMHDLVEAMEEFLPGDLGPLGDELKALDAFQEICDPYNFTITPPTMDEVARMLELAGKIRTLTERRIAN
ncbi:MAG: hypothetical protein KKG47_04360 [Proteobacteria bacterium]|nr:hypothetical protein [Pseudomonadota bacterium]MBU1738175.1 hypothetical protein [Pseudomonadota bacterium]